MAIHSTLDLQINPECSNNLSISDLFVLAEVEVLPYRFEPEESDSKCIGHIGELDSNDFNYHTVHMYTDKNT